MAQIAHIIIELAELFLLFLIWRRVSQPIDERKPSIRVFTPKESDILDWQPPEEEEKNVFKDILRKIKK